MENLAKFMLAGGNILLELDEESCGYGESLGGISGDVSLLYGWFSIGEGEGNGTGLGWGSGGGNWLSDGDGDGGGDGRGIGSGNSYLSTIFRERKEVIRWAIE